MTKNLILSAVVALVVATGCAIAFNPVVDTDGIAATVLAKVQATFGAVTGPDDSFPCKTSNGVTTCSERKALTTATTTPCAIKSPSATSTLIRATAMVTVASSTATTWTIAKAANAFATTTPMLQDITLASGVQGVLLFAGTSTPAGVAQVTDPKYVFAPNTFAVWGRAGTVEADTTLFKGACTATFQVI